MNAPKKGDEYDQNGVEYDMRIENTGKGNTAAAALYHAIVFQVC